MSPVHVVHVAEEFSPFPGGRYRAEGPSSGEEFCERFGPLMAKFDQVTFDLDRTVGLPPSFLEAAFGGLVRAAPSFGLTPAEMGTRIKVSSEDHPAYEELARRIIDAAVTLSG